MQRFLKHCYKVGNVQYFFNKIALSWTNQLSMLINAVDQHTAYQPAHSLLKSTLPYNSQKM
jgi:hypothetical protein